mmetsp:Transcript_29989/g.29225  ORF Transcript_29989/g.29225 Transcript_29989/m.29225 type:complete len:85 (+) Transcript_29989:375-629(+)
MQVASHDGHGVHVLVVQRKLDRRLVSHLLRVHLPTLKSKPLLRCALLISSHLVQVEVVVVPLERHGLLLQSQLIHFVPPRPHPT